MHPSSALKYGNGDALSGDWEQGQRTAVGSGDSWQWAMEKEKIGTGESGYGIALGGISAVGSLLI